MEKEKKLAIWETLCVLFWLLLDGFWLLEWQFLTYTSSFLALSASAVTFFYLEKRLVFYLIGLADFLWLLMNILWITSDFYQIGWCHSAAIICFVLAAGLLLIAYAKSDARNTIQDLILRRLRILRSFLFPKIK